MGTGERTSAGSQRTIAVWGHFHGGNLGDELVVETLVRAIRERAPAARVIAISLAPEDTERRHRVPAFPLNPGRPVVPGGTGSAPAQATGGGRGLARRAARRVPGARRLLVGAHRTRRLLAEPRFSARAFRLLRDVDTLVVTGSGQLLDAWQGPWGHPLSTFRWALVARAAGTRLLVPSVGAGPVDARLSAALIRRALARAAFVSVRDADSERVLRAVGVRRPLSVRPDMGWAFHGSRPAEPSRTGQRVRVGVNVVDPRYWPLGGLGSYDAYVEKMASVVALLLDDCEVVLFSSHRTADDLVARDLLAHLADRGVAPHPRLSSRHGAVGEVDDLVATVASCDYVIAGRFHAVLVPLALGIPTLGVAYHPKTRELLGQVGQADRCVDLEAFESDELYALFGRIRAEDGPAARRDLARRAAEQAAAVETQFDELFGERGGRHT